MFEEFRYFLKDGLERDLLDFIDFDLRLVLLLVFEAGLGMWIFWTNLDMLFARVVKAPLRFFMHLVLHFLGSSSLFTILSSS